MKRKLVGRLLAIALLSMALTLLISVALFKTAFERQAAEDLKESTELMAAGYTAHPDEALLDAYAAAGFRVTLVDGQGGVLYDSQADKGAMENHLSRPEISQALSQGRGEDERTSATVGLRTFYYAIVLPDGTVLRSAKELGVLYLFYRQAMPWLLVIAVALLVLSMLSAVYLTRRLIQPIEAMAEHIGEIDQVVPYPELAPFAAALRDNYRRREENERIRREFTANVSHELKTPLTSISGYAEMIETGLAKPEDVKDFAGKIRFEASRLIGLIGDIIQLSELDDPAAPGSFAPVDLLEATHSTVEYLSFSAEKRDVTLHVVGEHLIVQGKRSLLEELVYNLCDNAIRYNKPGGEVRVEIQRREGRVCLTVSDNGIGIPPEHQSRIFERFYRVDKSHSKETGGTGLGLAIVKHVALSHGGKITVSSAVGQGTRIQVSFPPAEERGAQEALQAQSRQNRQKNAIDQKRG